MRRGKRSAYGQRRRRATSIKLFYERTFGYIRAMMVEELRTDTMMSYLLDSLDQGKDIGHYGRLVFTMIARHFGSADEIVAELTKDETLTEDDARLLIAQVEEADYSPPKRAKILDFQSRQDFPIIPDVDDPDAGNVYRDLKFPDHVYEHIAQYREAKAHTS